MRLFVILILFTLPGTVFAQIQPDSVLLFGQDRRAVDFASQNATQLLGASYLSLGSNSLSYNTQNGHFRQSQQAESNNAIHFNTAGIQTLGRFKLQGSFDFERMVEDSLANVMKGLANDVTPYYYMATKAGQYRRLNYTLKGIATYELIKNKLFVASGINYLYNNTSRSVDPRPSIQTFQVLFKPELVYHTGNHFIGAGVDYGYGTENIAVGYKNRQYAEGNTYPDRILYLIRGYGFSDRPDEQRFKKRYSYNGYHINYSVRNARWLLNANFNYAGNVEENLLPLVASVNDRLFSTFYLNSYAVKTLLAYKGQQLKHQLYADINWQSGYDNIVLSGGTNYRFRSKTINAGYSIIKNESNFELVPEFGITMGYREIYHRDISAQVTSQQSYLQPGVLFALYKKYHDLSRLSFRLEPSLRLPLQKMYDNRSDLHQYFTNNVAAPDHVYLSSTSGLINTNITYLTPHLFKGINSGIGFDAGYIRPLKNYSYDYQGPFMPAGHRLYTSFSLIIYF